MRCILSVLPSGSNYHATGHSDYRCRKDRPQADRMLGKLNQWRCTAKLVDKTGPVPLLSLSRRRTLKPKVFRRLDKGVTERRWDLQTLEI